MPDDVFEKVDLPSGGWVSFRDPKSLTERERKPLKRALNRIGLAANLQSALKGEIPSTGLTDSELDLFEGIMEATVVVLTDDWSFEDSVDGEPVKRPVTSDSLNDLLHEDYEAIVDAAARHRDVLLPDFNPGEKTDSEGRENPTGRSPESKPPSAGSRRTGRSPTSSEPGSS